MYLHIHEYNHTHAKKPDMIEHSCNHKIEKAMNGRRGVCSQPGLYSETLSLRNKVCVGLFCPIFHKILLLTVPISPSTFPHYLIWLSIQEF